MELSPLARNLISRATALCVGLALCYASYRTLNGIRAAAADAAEQRMQQSRGTRVVGAQPLQYVLLAITGVPGVIFVGFAIVPTRVLHAIDPSPSTADGDDVAGVIRRVGRL